MTPAQAEPSTDAAVIEANPELLITPQERTALTDLFTYHPAAEQGIAQMKTIRAAGLDLALTITASCPKSADRSAAIRHVRDACMTANAAIVLNGRNL